MLSGSQLQGFAITDMAMKTNHIYIFTESSSYLGVKHCLTSAHMIKQVPEHMELGNQRYVLVEDHSLTMLDYMSDYVCLLYNGIRVYNIANISFSVHVGIERVEMDLYKGH